MQNCQSNSSSIEGVELCSDRVDQSNTSMLTKNRNPETVGQDHCIRPETLQNSHHFRLSLQNSKILKTNLYTMNQPQPPCTEVNVLNNTFTNVSLRSNTILNWTVEQTDLLIFVENFPINSPNFSRPRTRFPLRSCQMGSVSRIKQIRQHNRTRERAARTRFVAARINSRKEGHAQLLEAMRRCRLSKPGKIKTPLNLKRT